MKADAGGNAVMSKLINWTYTRNEYGTDGAEFVIRRGKTDGEDGLTIRPPVNPSTVNYISGAGSTMQCILTDLSFV